MTDKFSVGKDITATAAFGYIDTATANFENPPVSGIWGLAYPTTSSWNGGGAFADIVTQTGIYDGFSMCLQDGAGMMTLGEDFGSNSKFQWAPRIGNAYYSVDMTDLQVGGQSLNLAPSVYNDPFSIVDSGTTLIIFASETVNALQTAFNGLCSSKQLPGVCGVTQGNTLFDGYCFRMSSSDISNFPDLTFVIAGLSLTITSQEYLIPQQQYMCLGIVSGGSGFGTILGDTFMRKFHVAFDRAGSRVGFGPVSTCPGSKSSFADVLRPSLLLVLMMIQSICFLFL